MKKGKLLGMIAMVALLLTGCVDNMPDMTKEQSELVAEYAAGLLLKYSPNYEYGLADDEALVEEETLIEESSIEESSNEETSTEEAAEKESSKEEESSVTTEIDIHVGADKTEPDVKYIPINSTETVVLQENPYEVELADVIEATDLGIRYTYYEICNEYPNGSSNSGFTVQPQKGKKLLVIHFKLENKSNEALACDLFDSGIRMKVNLNEQGFEKTMSTLLMNDITTYIEDVKAGESTDVVTVMEVDAATEEEITSLNLLMECGANRSALQLK
ncbi:MAG: DUF5067 domain-containing protein [Lachnospiraceae bacterium]|nr:DUF5067 domain-containing protein [Lachnospiraceae bacterium]